MGNHVCVCVCACVYACGEKCGFRVAAAAHWNFAVLCKVLVKLSTNVPLLHGSARYQGGSPSVYCNSKLLQVMFMRRQGTLDTASSL